MNQAPLAVRASGLVKRYGDVLAVDGLDLEIPAGQFFGLLGPNGGVGYQRFLIPGVLGMSMLFGAMLAALSMVYDKESGVMRMLIVAPFPHYWIVIAKMLAAALAAILKAVSLANPYTYGVDLLKHATLGVLPSGMGADFPVWIDLAVLAGFTSAALLVASWRFSRESAYEPMIRVLTGKRDQG